MLLLLMATILNDLVDQTPHSVELSLQVLLRYSYVKIEVKVHGHLTWRYVILETYDVSCLNRNSNFRSPWMAPMMVELVLGLDQTVTTT